MNGLIFVLMMVMVTVPVKSFSGTVTSIDEDECIDQEIDQFTYSIVGPSDYLVFEKMIRDDLADDGKFVDSRVYEEVLAHLPKVEPSILEGTYVLYRWFRMNHAEYGTPIRVFLIPQELIGPDGKRTTESEVGMIGLPQQNRVLPAKEAAKELTHSMCELRIKMFGVKEDT